MCGSSLATIGYPPCCAYSMLSTLQLLSYLTKNNLKDIFIKIKIMRTHDRDEAKAMGFSIFRHYPQDEMKENNKQRTKCKCWIVKR